MRKTYIVCITSLSSFDLYINLFDPIQIKSLKCGNIFAIIPNKYKNW